MIPNRLSRRLLRLLLNSRQNDEIIDFMDACEACAARPYALLKVLHSLSAAGLVESGRLRLTLEGLAVASALALPTEVGPHPASPHPASPQPARPHSARLRLARRAA